MASLRMRFWWLCMDVIDWCGGYGSPLWLYCVGKASDADPSWRIGEAGET